MFTLELSSNPCNSFLMLLIQSVFLLCFFCSYILLRKLFCFFWIQLVIYPCAFSTDLLVEFSFVILGGLILYCLILSYLLTLSSFTNIFWLISSSCIGSLVCCCFLVFLLHCVFVYFPRLYTFACFHSFFICPSSLISHPRFVFLFGFLNRMPILSLTSFAPV